MLKINQHKWFMVNVQIKEETKLDIWSRNKEIYRKLHLCHRMFLVDLKIIHKHNEIGFCADSFKDMQIRVIVHRFLIFLFHIQKIADFIGNRQGNSRSRFSFGFCSTHIVGHWAKPFRPFSLNAFIFLFQSPVSRLIITTAYVCSIVSCHLYKKKKSRFAA